MILKKRDAYGGLFQNGSYDTTDKRGEPKGLKMRNILGRNVNEKWGKNDFG